MIKPDKPDSATTLKGLDYIDVPGLSKREYKLNFFAHKEGPFSAKVRLLKKSGLYSPEACNRGATPQRTPRNSRTLRAPCPERSNILILVSFKA